MSLLGWRWISRMEWLMRSLHSGLWLGILSHSTSQDLNRLYYDDARMYHSSDYNASGLFLWEQEIVKNAFEGLRDIVVIGAGAGREVAALSKMGMDCTGYECHEGLRKRGREILDSTGARGDILPMLPDHCPDFPRPPEGIIIGWGVYGLIRGRDTRIQLLRDLREAVRPQAPLMLSFYLQSGPRWSYELAWRLGKSLGAFSRAPKVEFGDSIGPRYGHFFSLESLDEELRAGGWTLSTFEKNPYPHAVAIAAPASNQGRHSGRDTTP